MTQNSGLPAFRYYAFISYSHQDKAWADWLHKALEAYVVPKRLVGQTTADGAIPKRLTPIFRDRDELASAHDLGRKVNEALAQSANLIVICSPRSAASHWVQEEVLAYKQLGRSERIFCLIVDGEPNASDLPGREPEECFVPALRLQLDADGQPTTQRAEPIAADARADKDGKTNAKLKLIAGMLGVGFDALKQRELRRRARRMTAVAGFGLLGMAIMAVFAGVAVHERNNALKQRAQAEDLIGFMLGNLRTKLEAVNRLDILDDVADHALYYFEAQTSPGSIDSRSERAAALLLLGRVRLDQGKATDAEQAFNESLHLSETLAVDGNHLPGLDLAVVDAQSWLGKSAWQTGKIEQALAHFNAELPVLLSIRDTHPDNRKALERLAWLHADIGHVQEARGASGVALQEYRAELEVALKLTADQSANRDFQKELAHAHDNIAALLYARGDFDGAENHYSADRNILKHLVANDPNDADSTDQLAIAETFLAQVAQALGHTDSARDSLRQAVAIGNKLLADDSGNMDKLANLASYSRRLARNLRLSGDLADAASLLERATSLHARLLKQAPDDIRGRYGLAATQLEQAELARQRGDNARAHDLANESSRRFTALVHVQSYERDASLGVASADLLLGKLFAASADTADATAQWSRALDALRAFDNNSQEPDQLDVQAELLTRLGRESEAQPLIARLKTMHYRDPAFVAWRQSTAAASADASNTASRSPGDRQ